MASRASKERRHSGVWRAGGGSWPGPWGSGGRGGGGKLGPGWQCGHEKTRERTYEFGTHWTCLNANLVAINALRTRADRLAPSLRNTTSSLARYVSRALSTHLERQQAHGLQAARHGGHRQVGAQRQEAPERLNHLGVLGRRGRGVHNKRAWKAEKAMAVSTSKRCAARLLPGPHDPTLKYNPSCAAAPLSSNWHSLRTLHTLPRTHAPRAHNYPPASCAWGRAPAPSAPHPAAQPCRSPAT